MEVPFEQVVKDNKNIEASQVGFHQSPRTIPLSLVHALDMAITFCFLLFHETRLPPKNVKYLEVNLL